MEDRPTILYNHDNPLFLWLHLSSWLSWLMTTGSQRSTRCLDAEFSNSHDAPGKPLRRGMLRCWIGQVPWGPGSQDLALTIPVRWVRSVSWVRKWVKDEWFAIIYWLIMCFIIHMAIYTEFIYSIYWLIICFIIHIHLLSFIIMYLYICQNGLSCQAYQYVARFTMKLSWKSGLFCRSWTITCDMMTHDVILCVYIIQHNLICLNLVLYMWYDIV